MPTKTMRACAEDGCPMLSEDTRCTFHRKAKRKAEDKRRPSAKARGYDKRWSSTRSSYLALHPICQHEQGCIDQATDVHHLDGKGPRGPRGHDWTNLQGLCHGHHSQRTSTEQPGGWHGPKK